MNADLELKLKDIFALFHGSEAVVTEIRIVIGHKHHSEVLGFDIKDMELPLDNFLETVEKEINKANGQSTLDPK